MLIEVDERTFSEKFPHNPHPFISEPFIRLNQGKVGKIVRLIDDDEKVGVGLIAGLKNGILLSPFSAPFGGFHFRNELIYISEIEKFISMLQNYIQSHGLLGIDIILPPNLYHFTFNAKTVNSLIRNGFQLKVPDLTNWIDLQKYNGIFLQRNSREYYKQALKHRLTFDLVLDEKDKLEAFNLVCENRKKFDRPIFMNFEDIVNTAKLWPVDFFKVCTMDRSMCASAIIYRSHPDIIYVAFWGDNEIGRPLRAMDYLLFNLWLYFKKLGFKYIDIGISTETGNPNEGLLRFKETHEAVTSLRFRFYWHI
jgi:hypothetical protein